MPLWNKPILQHTLDMISGWGVQEVLINLHHGADKLFEWVQKEKEQEWPRLRLSYEPEILGTGGALKYACWFIDEPFWLINGDVAADLNPSPLITYHVRHHPIATLWMHPSKGPRSVEVKNQQVKSFRADASKGTGMYTFCGLHLVNPDILEFIPESGFSSIITAYEQAMKKGRSIAGLTIKDAYWADLGTPRQYREAHREIMARSEAHHCGSRLYDFCTEKRLTRFREKGIDIQGFAACSDTCEIRSGASIKDSVLWEGSVLYEGAHVHDCIAGPEVLIRGYVENIAVPGKTALREYEIAALKKQGWRTDKITVEVLPARGSERVFMRIFCPRDTMMLVRYNPERRENTLYATHAQFLQSLDVAVPGVYHHDRDKCFILMQDIGRKSLLNMAGAVSPKTLLRYYREVLHMAARMHNGLQAAQKASVPLMPGFDVDLYAWEHELFLKYFAAGLHVCSKQERYALSRELSAVAEQLINAKPVLIHRDLQSSNAFYHKKRFYLIDFQGMRSGAAAYDLAALLCDPYVMPEHTTQVHLLDYYVELTGRQSVADLFWMSAIQRLTQALGAYGRMGRHHETRRFLDYIPSALQMLDRALGEVPGSYPALAGICRHL